MSDIKSYGVEYVLNVNTGRAVEKLSAFAKSIQEQAKPFQNFTTAINGISSALNRISELKKSGGLDFKPTIHPEEFFSTLRKMVTEVEKAAADMQAALYRGLTGTPAKSAMAKGVGNALKQTATNMKSRGYIEQKIESAKTDLRLLGKEFKNGKWVASGKTGALQRHLLGSTIDEQVKNAKANLKMWQQELKKWEQTVGKADRSTQQQATAIKAQANANKASATTGINATNLEALNKSLAQWNKTFGNSKTGKLSIAVSLTKGSMAKVTNLATKLNSLPTEKTITINPVVTKANFDTVANQLRSLKKLQESITQPFNNKSAQSISKKLNTALLSKSEQQSLGAAQAKVESLNAKIKQAQDGIARYQTAYGSSMSAQQKGQITKWNTQIAESKEALKQPQKVISQLTSKATRLANAPKVDIVGRLTSVIGSEKVRTISVVAKVTKILNPQKKALDAAAKVSAGNVQNALKTIDKNKQNPTINLTLTTGEAIAALNQFVEAVKAKSPQTIRLQASGAAAGAASGAAGGVTSSAIRGAQSAKNGKGTTGTMPLGNKVGPESIRERFEEQRKVWAKNEKSFNRDRWGKKGKAASNRVFEQTMQARHDERARMYQELFRKPPKTWWDRQIDLRNWQRPQMIEDAKAAFKNLTPYEKSFFPTSVGSGKNKVVWGAQPEQNTAPNGYKWVKSSNLETHLSNPQKDELTRLRGVETKAQNRVTQIQSNIAKAQDKMIARQEALVKQCSTIEKQLAPHLRRMANLEKSEKSLAALTSPTQKQKKELERIRASKAQVQAEIDKYRKIQDRLVDRSSHYSAVQRRYDSMVGPIHAKAQQQYAAAQQEVARYTEGWQLAPVKGTPSKHWVKQAEALRAEAHNAMLPFASNKGQLNLLTKYRRYFNEATAYTGITPTSSTSNVDMLKYLKGVQQVMYNRGVAIPVELQSHMNKLEQQIAKASAAPRAKDVARAQQWQAKVHNAMLPFASNKGQLNVLTKYHRFFETAMKTTGIRPTASTSNTEMLKYLRGVQAQMSRFNVATPFELQSHISKLEQAIAKAASAPKATGMAVGGGGGARAAAPASAYAKARSWAYPFTGGTSFGTRTPMAVDMAKGMGVMFAISGAMSGISGSFSQAMEYQNVMKTAEAILQHSTDSYTPDRFKEMAEIVREVGVKTKFSAPEVANAAKFLAMAGFDINNINHSIRPIANLALIGDLDLGETADKMTNIMTTFGIKPERMNWAADIMTNTANRTNTDLMMLAESAKYGGGVANLFGKGDPNLFADTMALFGVMGNAGIQGSSAGTALRMMYMNIFNPNKKQAAALAELEKRGISRKNKDGSDKGMAEFLKEVAEKVDEKEFKDIVSKLFRITAQSGAGAVLNAAVANNENIEEVMKGYELLEESMGTKEMMSTLATLMESNRAAGGSGISNAIAEDKQNTISGLFAQVTSTFTEGVVQAFERRQGGFAEMLKSIRDYLAKPQTISMIQHLLDLIVSIGKVMAWFVEVWANLYSACPGLIKTWVTVQMFFTQLGTLGTPLIAMMGVFDRLRGAIMKVNSISMTSMALSGGAAGASGNAGRVVAGNVAGGALASMTMNGPLGRTAILPGAAVTQKFAAQKSASLATNAFLAGFATLGGASYSNTLDNLNVGTKKHYAEVQRRYNRRFGAGARFVKAFKGNSNFVTGKFGLPSILSSFKAGFAGLLGSLGSILGLLFNPVTAVVAALGAAGFGLYKLKQYIDGNTDTQIRAREKVLKAADVTGREMKKMVEWHDKLLSKDAPKPAEANSSENQEALDAADKKRKERKKQWGILATDITEDANSQTNEAVTQKWTANIKSNPLYKLALGADYNNLTGEELYSKPNTMGKYVVGPSGVGTYVVQATKSAKVYAKEIQQKQMQAILMIEGAQSPIVQEALTNIDKAYDLFDKNQIDGWGLNQKIVEIIGAAYEKLDSLPSIPMGDMSLEKFWDIPDMSVYSDFQRGAKNILDAYLLGDVNTLTGKRRAYKQLQNNTVESLTDEWREQIAKIAGDFEVFYPFRKNGEAWDKLKTTVDEFSKMGGVDTKALAKKLKDSVDGFGGSLREVMDIIAKFYASLLEGGHITQEEYDKEMNASASNSAISYKDALEYYDSFIGPQAKSEWKDASIGREQYARWVISPDRNATIKTATRTVTAGEERNLIKYNVKKASIAANPANAPTSGSGKNGGGGKTTSTTPSSPSQDGYKPKYEAQASMPHVTNINIQNMANFDRTAIASSAEERDIMAQLEDRIAQGVYQIFAMASQQANAHLSGNSMG